ncbi:MAG: SDR family oxidoreductase [Alphaproteobacteria bacterium]|nr:SDR family oxidoreductase [Alphaproteobacteria bacterium]
MSEEPHLEDGLSDNLKNVIVTGASRGIGHTTARYFRDKGWRILTCSRDDTPEACKRDPYWTAHIPTDLFDPESTQAFVDEALEVLDGQPVHALVNNAGWSPKTDYKERLGCLNGDVEAWHSVFELNFFAPLRLARGFAGSLAKGKGAVVNVTSIAGHRIHPFAGSAYSTSKAALSALTREMAAEFAQIGVRVNAVAPGEIETDMVSGDYEMLIPRIPMQRMGQPKDVAATIFSLCDPEHFGYVTGEEIFITGGQHLY